MDNKTAHDDVKLMISDKPKKRCCNKDKLYEYVSNLFCLAILITIFGSIVYFFIYVTNKESLARDLHTDNVLCNYQNQYTSLCTNSECSQLCNLCVSNNNLCKREHRDTSGEKCITFDKNRLVCKMCYSLVNECINIFTNMTST
jgi:hypothetical protein